MWVSWWTKWHWGRFSQSTSVSHANIHSTDCSTITVIWATYQAESVSPHPKILKKKKTDVWSCHIPQLPWVRKLRPVFRMEIQKFKSGTFQVIMIFSPASRCFFLRSSISDVLNLLQLQNILYSVHCIRVYWVTLSRAHYSEPNTGTLEVWRNTHKQRSINMENLLELGPTWSIQCDITSAIPVISAEQCELWTSTLWTREV
jgi:hypothetical protein